MALTRYLDLHNYSDLVIQSEGWSGNVIHANSINKNDRSFRFDIEHTCYFNQFGYDYSLTATGGYIAYTGGSSTVVGISLEKMGQAVITSGEDVLTQCIGGTLQGNYINPENAYGRNSDNTEGIKYDQITFDEAVINTSSTTTQNNVSFSALGLGGGAVTSCQRWSPTLSGWYDFSGSVTITTDLPIFATDADLIAWAEDPENEDLQELILNRDQTTPEESYNNALKYWYIKQLSAHGSGSSWTADRNSEYRFTPKKGKICLYQQTPTLEDPYNLVLYNYSDYDVFLADYTNDDNDFTSVGAPAVKWLSTSVKLNDTLFRVSGFHTNILIYANKNDADDYIAGLKTPEDAVNWQDVARDNQDILAPQIGDADTGNDNGTNGQVYSYGARMHVMTALKLAAFFGEVFSTANIDDILDGTKLFGTNQINALGNITYFPCPISDFCDVGGGTTIFVGSWQANTSSDGFVIKNNKLIDCGGAMYDTIYGDFRDFEPYMMLYIYLPYCGIHQLQISKYYGKYLSVKYSIDVTTGACSAHIYADGIELDTVDGTMASTRPISAIDQTTYLSNVIGAVNSSFAPATNVASGGANALSGAASGNIAGAVSGLATMGGGAVDGVIAGYNVKQAVDDPPMTQRGGFAGCLGFFGPQKIHLIFAQKKSIRPANELNVIGYPSGQGGTVGSFAGFLKCSAFKMADGFTGTREELNDIMAAMSNGIYV